MPAANTILVNGFRRGNKVQNAIIAGVDEADGNVLEEQDSLNPVEDVIARRDEHNSDESYKNELETVSNENGPNKADGEPEGSGSDMDKDRHKGIAKYIDINLSW